MKPVTELGLVLSQGLPLVDAEINGRTGLFVLDTGASDTVLTDSFVHRLGLTVRPSSERGGGLGGEAVIGAVHVASITLGNARAQDATLLDIKDPSITKPDGMPIDGLIGGDILSNYDLRLDLHAAHVTLFRTERCGVLAPFGSDAFSAPLYLFDNQAGIIAWLDGHPVGFLIDTGSNRTLVSLATAHVLGVDPSHDRTINAAFIGPDAVRTMVHTFHSLKIGAETVRNPALAVIDDDGVNILGDDLLSLNTVWLSYRTNRVYIAPLPTLFTHARRDSPR